MLALLLTAVLTISPADEMRSAAADVEALPLEVRPTTRYLTLYSIDPEKRAATIETTSYVLNALSRSRAISRPQLVSPTLLRFDITQYASGHDEQTDWTAAWEKLAESDPYFHLRTEVLVEIPGRKSEVGSRRKAEVVSKGSIASHSDLRSPTSDLRTVTTDGGWTDLIAAARLHAATGSTGALLRAEYFLSQATVPPRYYEFTGVPDTESEFLKSLGVDREAIQKLRADAGANLIISGVTEKPRRIVWCQGPLGGVYSTLDVEKVDAERDPLRRPITASGLAFRYDVSEWFALAPNGLWRTALFNAVGRRQDSVPDKVAKDTSDPHGDGIVVPMISCIRCHREGGLRPFADDQTRLLSSLPLPRGEGRGEGVRVNLYSQDPNIVQRATGFYDEPRLQRQIEFDRQSYAAAVARATGGMNPGKLSDSLATAVREFAYLPVTSQQAATEVGLSANEFQQALAATRDPVILLLLQGREVLRGQWESSFPEAALTAAAFLPRRHGDTEKK